MILSNAEIIEEIESGRLVFTPELERERQVGTSSVDLKLGEVFKVFRAPEELDEDEVPGMEVLRRFDPVTMAPFYKQFMQKYTKLLEPDSQGRYVLQSQSFMLAQTLEIVTLPLYLAGRVEGRSSLARLGLSIHNTAPTIHAGFDGVIALELL